MSRFRVISLKNAKGALISIGIAETVGFLGGLLTMGSMGFYKTLEKPPASPPGWLFPVVWAVLYALMGLAAYRVWKSDGKSRERGLWLYALQLAMNFLWSIFFFRFQWIGFSALWLAALIFVIVLTIVEFYRNDKIAGVLMLPYLLWCFFAFYLNFSIWILN